MAFESFNAYHSYLNAMDPLNDAERGRLFTACLIYSKTGEVPDLRGTERFIFPQMKWQIDRDKDKENTPHTPQGVAFDAFWKAYPKKVGKEAARKAFGKVKKPIESLLTAIERQKCSDQWTKDNGQYIPNPATWLNQGRWDDELSIQGEMDSSGTSRKPKRYREEMIDGQLVAVEVEDA